MDRCVCVLRLRSQGHCQGHRQRKARGDLARRVPCVGTLWRMAMQEAGLLNHKRVATRNITSLNQFFNRSVIIVSTTITSIIVAMLFLENCRRCRLYSSYFPVSYMYIYMYGVLDIKNQLCLGIRIRAPDGARTGP